MHAVELDQILGPWLFAPHPELGIVVLPLPRQHAIEIEGGGLHLEVPFADHGSVVPCPLHFLGEVLALRLDAPAEIVRPTSVGILPGYYGGSTGGADGIRAKGVLEEHALLGQAIDGGCGVQFGEATTVGPDGLRGMVVRHDEQDIWLLGR